MADADPYAKMAKPPAETNPYAKWAQQAPRAEDQPSEGWLGQAQSAVAGLRKGAVEGSGITDIMPHAAISQWATSSNPDPDLQTAENIGYYAPDVASLWAIPDVGLETMAVKAIGKAGKMPQYLFGRGGKGYAKPLHVAAKSLEGTWKGAVGGETQGDPQTGAEVGTARRAATATWDVLPAAAKRNLWLLATLAAAPYAQQLARQSLGGREGYFPMFHGVHMSLPYLAQLAAFLMPSGVAGAAGAKAVQDSQPSNQ